MTDSIKTTDAMRHKLIADLFDLPVWERGQDRVVTPALARVDGRRTRLACSRLKQWRPA